MAIIRATQRYKRRAKAVPLEAAGGAQNLRQDALQGVRRSEGDASKVHSGQRRPQVRHRHHQASAVTSDRGAPVLIVTLDDLADAIDAGVQARDHGEGPVLMSMSGRRIGPAYRRPGRQPPSRRCGDGTSDV
jgi:hypothetical protein